MIYVTIIWKLVKAHWPIALAAAGLVAAFVFGYREGVRAGYHRGYAAAEAAQPKISVKESCNAKIEAPKCEAKDPEVRIKYVRIPGTPPSCPPVPEVSITGGSAVASSGTTEAKSDSEIVRTPTVDVSHALPDNGGSNRVWRVSGLVGAGGGGLEVGGSLGRSLGPVELGIYVRSPIHDAKQASAGLSVGVKF